MHEQWIKCIGMCLLTGICYTVIRILVLKKKNAEILCRQELIYLCLIIYITAVLEILIIPKINIFIMHGANGIELSYSIAGNFNEKMLNLIPFKTLHSQIDSLLYHGGVPHPLTNLTANLLIMLPMPILIHLTNHKIKGCIPLLITLAIIITVECIQYFIGRSCDIDDVILNMSGATIGYTIYTVIRKK